MIAALRSLDLAALQYLASIREPQTAAALIWVSEFGRWTTIFGLALLAALLLLMRRHFFLAISVLVNVATSGVFVLVLKGLFARARPPWSVSAYREAWMSFPSAHAAMSLALYGFLVYLLWRTDASRIVKYAALFGAVVLVATIGFSRLYLGVHYPSDVFGGFVVGALCLALSIWTVRMYTR